MLVDDGSLGQPSRRHRRRRRRSRRCSPRAWTASRRRARGHRGGGGRGQGVHARARRERCVAGAAVDRRTWTRCSRKEPVEPAGEHACSASSHQLIRDAAYDGHGQAAARGTCTSGSRTRPRRRGTRGACSATTSSAPSCCGGSWGSRRWRRRRWRPGDGEPQPPPRGAPRSARTRPPRSALLERALALAGRDAAVRATLLPALGAALFEAGRMSRRDPRPRRARSPRRTTARWPARRGVEREFVRLESETSAGTERARRRRRRACVVLEHAGDDHGHAAPGRCGRRSSGSAGTSPRRRGVGQAAEHARARRRRARAVPILGWRATAAVLGPTPVAEAIERCEAFRERVGASPAAVALDGQPARLAARHARRLRARRARPRGGQRDPASASGVGSAVSHHEAIVCLLAAGPTWPSARCAPACAAARRPTITGCWRPPRRCSRRRSSRRPSSTRPSGCARSPSAHRPRTTSSPQVIWRGVQAKILAGARGRGLGARSGRARGATDLLSHHGDALLDLAHVLRANHSAYRDTVEEALSLYERKGNAAAPQRRGGCWRSIGGHIDAVQLQLHEIAAARTTGRKTCSCTASPRSQAGHAGDASPSIRWRQCASTARPGRWTGSDAQRDKLPAIDEGVTAVGVAHRDGVKQPSLWGQTLEVKAQQ